MSQKIHFFTDDIFFKPKHKGKIRSWIEAICNQEEKKVGQLSLIFVSDEKLLKINLEYLNHDFYTDIVTFQDDEDPTKASGELYISIDRISENAKSNKCSFENELLRVIIHGTLHLMGWKDKTKSEQAEMRARENEALLLWEKISNT